MQFRNIDNLRYFSNKNECVAFPDSFKISQKKILRVSDVLSRFIIVLCCMKIKSLTLKYIEILCISLKIYLIKFLQL